ncbi:MAG: prepilin-type N-terminal cleavage/methylation domain-containing protein [Candidatus Taylorbacteria bacterium]|nr:prepilin-type N-terminal cleavage/methylation domain-containing protein [Candidatus Taylorbacteria bacterium]
MKIENSNGFTLVEVMVALGLTSLIIGVVTSLLFVALSVQRQSLAVQGILSQGSTVTEYMARAIKQAQKETGQGCLSAQGLNYELTHFGKGIKFVNAQGECQDFYWEGDPVYRIKETRGAQTLFLSPDDISILAFNPFLAGQSQADTIQPRVTLFLDIQAKGVKPGSQERFQIQTSISQRAHDIVQ